MSRNSQQQQQPAFIVFDDEEDALLDVNTAFLIKSPTGAPSSPEVITTPTDESVTQQLFGNDFENEIDLSRDTDNENDDDDDEIVRTNTNRNNDDDNDNNDNNSSEEERRRRYYEEQQSIELARQLMAEEAMLSYHHHIQYLRESANELSQEDYDALQRALQEDMVGVVGGGGDVERRNVDDVEETNSILDNENENGGSDEDDDNDDDNNNNEADLSYETMLYLSERIGDVKTERWTMIAQREINKLPTFQYTTTTTDNGNNNTPNVHGGGDSDIKCLICQCDYECNEELVRLPCHHAFHKDCVAHWLSTKDVCPYCRQCIVPERE